MGANEALGLQGVDTSQLWARGGGQEARRVQLGPRHPYLSLSLAGPMSFCLQKIRACSCSQAKLESGRCLLPAVRALAQQVRPHSESFSLFSRDCALPQWDSPRALLGATDSQLFSGVQRIIQSFLLPATQYPIITMARDAVCTYRLATLS